ncbi:hypothetical protein AS359_03100 [Comamonas kerstersii]|uniref:Uncharacterized protein n=1 Tax=Comamonas kerstersii TaxID=225992 RepID=A0A0W7Z010_9BURK|nr:hypothetical protein AS359_03100 [Comamonas kerstersii]
MFYKSFTVGIAAAITGEKNHCFWIFSIKDSICHLQLNCFIYCNFTTRCCSLLFLNYRTLCFKAAPKIIIVWWN